MKTKSLPLLFVCLLILCVVRPAPAAGPDAPAEPMGRLILAMSTDAAAVFDGAILIGTVALKRGHPVTMLLRLDAVKVAVAANHYAVGDTSLGVRLKAFMEAGGMVIAGGKCMKMMGLKPGDLIPGVAMGTPDLVMGTLFEDGARILSY